MAILTLRAISLNERPLTQPITAQFDAAGGTIGRADHNTLALPDPERHISRLQAEIRAEGSAYAIKNVGSSNPIMVGGRPLARGEALTLSTAMQIVIGGYLLEVIEGPATDAGEGAGGLLGTTTTNSRVRRALAEARRPPEAAAAGRAATAAAAAAPAASSAVATPQAEQAASAPGGASMPGARRGDTGRPGAERASAAHPFADLLPPGEPAAASVFGAARGAAEHARAGAAPSDPFTPRAAALPASAAAPLPDDFDPFARPARTVPPAPARGAAQEAGGAFGDLIPPGPASSLDAMFGLRQGDGEPLSKFMNEALPEPARRAAPAPSSNDPLSMFAPASSSPAASRAAELPATPDHTPGLRTAYAPPRPARPTPEPAAASIPAPLIPTDTSWLRPAATPMPLPSRGAATGEPRSGVPPSPAVHAPPDATRDEVRDAVPAATAPLAADHAAAAASAMASPQEQKTAATIDADALLAAFCDAAGIQLSPAVLLDEALMRRAGAMLREAVDGMLQLMAVRATTKHELRAQVTVIRSRSNNPLKFSPDVQAALEQLLQPPLRGFLSGPAAMSDAMHDLLGHAIGTMAGMRSALDGVLGRFAPGELERKLAAKSLIDSLLPMNRKARLWDLYLQHFETIREEAQEDFHTLFGRAFLAAYEAQIEQLQRDRPIDGDAR